MKIVENVVHGLNEVKNQCWSVAVGAGKHLSDVSGRVAQFVGKQWASLQVSARVSSLIGKVKELAGKAVAMAMAVARVVRDKVLALWSSFVTAMGSLRAKVVDLTHRGVSLVRRHS